MKIIAKKKKATPISPNISFGFDENVDQFLVGASKIFYTFDSTDHHVRKMKLNMGASNSSFNVNASITMTLNDDNGHDISANSYVDVTCLAALGQNTTSNVQLTGDLSYQSGASSAPINLQNPTFTNEAILEGFNLAYDKDHHVKRIHATVAVSPQQGRSVTLTGTDDMYDNNGHSASTKSLEAAYLGTYIKGSDCGLVAIEQSYSTDTKLTHVDLSTYLGRRKLTGAAVFVRSFDLSFGGDHHMQSMTVGASDIAHNDTTISFTPQVIMRDNGSNRATGNVTLVIIGTCDAS